jgi:GNAT superfamily N-acetyltransferase
MITCIKTNSENEDFRKLVMELDADLRIRDGDDFAFYSQFNKLDKIKYVIVAYQGQEPVGCGAIKAFSEDAVEVKRMYVLPNKRNLGIASTILKKLQSWAGKLNFKKCVLETGINQPEAIALYTKSGYKRIPNYGQYQNVETSLCFEKLLTE